MARYRGPKLRVSRTFGEPILGNLLKWKKKSYPPGQHGKRRKKRSTYGLQLAAKQKAKYIYGVLERYFQRLFKKAARERGDTGEILLQKLECRLDNTVYRLGLASSRAAARQLVSHKHVTINGRVVNIPSYSLKVGERIALTPKASKWREAEQPAKKEKAICGWLTWNAEKKEGSLTKVPERALIPEKINEKNITEFYSR